MNETLQTLSTNSTNSTNGTDNHTRPEHHHASHASQHLTPFLALAGTASFLATIHTFATTIHISETQFPTTSLRHRGARAWLALAALTITLLSGAVHAWMFAESLYRPSSPYHPSSLYRPSPLGLSAAAAQVMGVLTLVAVCVEAVAAFCWVSWLVEDGVKLGRAGWVRWSIRRTRSVRTSADDGAKEGCPSEAEV